YVVGSSVFPTSGAANPTLTIAAIALRVAAQLKAELAAPHATVATSQTFPELSLTRSRARVGHRMAGRTP
ncbi:MAG: GMC oxidoreductase, partial [Acetobacteraceae bacterium]|nr:GMC oxidoreductase [Acetobacteraceae bacterium]